MLGIPTTKSPVVVVTFVSLPGSLINVVVAVCEEVVTGIPPFLLTTVTGVGISEVSLKYRRRQNK